MADWPPAKRLQQFHYKCLQGMYFDERSEVAGGQLLFSSYVQDPYYNYFAGDELTLPEHISEAEPAFDAHGRTPAVYVGPDLSPAVTATLRDDGYSQYGTDSWLGLEIADQSDVTLPPSVSLEYVEPAGVEAYVDGFRAAYSGATKDDPYGDLDEGYAKALARAVAHPEALPCPTDFIQAVDGDQVVGVATLITRGDLAGCYGVGVAPSHRKHGIGHAIMDRLANDAFARGVRRIVLQTESGSPVEQWYQQMGYQHLFDAHYLTKSSGST